MDRPSRRQFLQGSLAFVGFGLLSGCGLLPPGAQRPTKMPRIGVLSVLAVEPYYEALRLGFRELGYTDGENIILEYRFADGQEERVPALAAELVRLPVDVIVAGDSTAARAANQASPAMPIVMAIGDPVESGLAASAARPGGNVTGLTNFNAAMVAKRLELLREIVPGMTRLGAIWNPTNPTKVGEWQEVQRSAQTLGVQVQSLEVRRPDDFAGVFAGAVQEGADALLVLGDPLTTKHDREIAELAVRHRLPSIKIGAAYARAGGLMAYGPNQPDMFRRAATYVDKILKGAKPADLPIEQPTTFDFVLNLKTAQALGLTIPQSVLLQATEVLQ